jgi:PUA domain protein
MPEQVDKGAIKFVLSGANIMCPGLTSPGGKMTPCEKNQIVVITAEGKHHALAIGQTKLSTNEMYVYYFYLFLIYFNRFFFMKCKFK